MYKEMYTLKDLPEIGEKYYFIFWETDYNGSVVSDIGVRRETFIADSFDFSYIRADMAFKTAEAAEREKYNVYTALTGKEWTEV